MPFDTRTFRVLIASPSDVEEEREIAVRVIQEWNDLYSFTRRVVLLPLRWETHSAPEYGTWPQEVINRAIAAREHQISRYSKDGLHSNALMKPRHIKKHCRLDPTSERLLADAVH
jgi:hypothetical protein